MRALTIIPALKIGGSPVCFLRDVTPPRVRVARCSKCDYPVDHPIARVCSALNCPLSHHDEGDGR